MQVRDFVGKRVCIDKIIEMTGANRFFDAGDYEDTELAVAVFMLRDFECGMTDRYGFTDYSLAVYLDGDRISFLQRVGHVHMCGQGMDDELRRFPHRALEKEASEKLREVLLQH